MEEAAGEMRPRRGGEHEDRTCIAGFERGQRGPSPGHAGRLWSIVNKRMGTSYNWEKWILPATWEVPGVGSAPEPPGRNELGRHLDLGLVRPEQAQPSCPDV